MADIQERRCHKNNKNKENKIKEAEMFKSEGYWNVTPKIKQVSFPRRGKFQVDLQDGKSIVMPVSSFPSLKKAPTKERKNWYLMGGGIT